ncbi:unnamed protein product [Musa acuminata subsp. malaccensis]|uniref:(wild Malaysian banana) hypothetical protein n=1 Tax=Musa acuminata subsp. malaccensis TaxID=214687 RepID=A0A804KL85_MUSAM|nr:PREDICTED: nudix hydrolase 18, mitochondrial-like isoform X1 [Musa acuminata subsp. malaccensis]CAG1835683.1 unnamed protein product [Musa acuminata subsp. malaccensis]
MVCMVSRQGRQLQRYSKSGSRLVVGCIPYKYNPGDGGGEDLDRSMEVLVISSPKGNGLLFPKGGWETDETIKEAALREALEEAGVQGNVQVSLRSCPLPLQITRLCRSVADHLAVPSLQRKLGKWKYKSRTYGAVHEGIMFPLNVTEELGDWPEMHTRERKWVTVADAKEGCQHPWMKEALDRLVKRLSSSSSSNNSNSTASAF